MPHTSLRQFALEDFWLHKVPPTAYYIPEYISKKDEEVIISNIYAAPKPKWTQLSDRRLQNWGGIPHQKGMIAEKIPQWLQNYLDKINSLQIMNNNRPNHVLVNEYLPSQGIMPHLDGSLFYPTITTISVGSHTVLKFSLPTTEDKMFLKPMFSLLLEPRSLLILQGELYHNYLHSIEELSCDIIDESVANLHMCSKQYGIGETVNRNTRISLTIRHVPKTTSFKINIGNK